MPEPSSQEIATRHSWECWPPGPMEPIPFHAIFSAAQYARIRRGFVPDVMEDKWFIYWEEDILYLHRSWTGRCIYRVHFESEQDAYEVSRAFVTAGEAQYRRAADDHEVRQLHFLIRALLLHECVRFPYPSWIGRWGNRGLYRYLVAGNVLTLEDYKPGALIRTWRRLQVWLSGSS